MSRTKNRQHIQLKIKYTCSLTLLLTCNNSHIVENQAFLSIFILSHYLEKTTMYTKIVIPGKKKDLKGGVFK